MFEEYQFLRYYIPGSLFTIYATVLIAPLMGPFINYLIQNPEALVGIAGGLFAGSLAVGYLIYAFYDRRNHPEMADPKKRPLYDYLYSKYDIDKMPLEKKKMFIQSIQNMVNDNYSGNLERFRRDGDRFWSHYHAKIVCSTYVPTLSALTTFLLFFSIVSFMPSALGLVIPNALNIIAYYSIIIGCILLITWVLRTGSEKTFKEAAEYEKFFFTQLIEDNGSTFKGLEKHKKDTSLPYLDSNSSGC